jgi:hypothetical protein
MSRFLIAEVSETKLMIPVVKIISHLHIEAVSRSPFHWTFFKSLIALFDRTLDDRLS